MKIISNSIRFWHTVKHFSLEQIFYSLYYPFKKKFYRKKNRIKRLYVENALNAPLITIPTVKSRINDKWDFETCTFTILNITHHFESNKIDWNLNKYGLLWQFTLHYFDFLNDKNVSFQNKLEALFHYIDFEHNSISHLHSYTISIRLQNWIYFCCSHEFENKQKVYTEIYSHANRLFAFPEYNLQGNHLLENAIAMQLAASFFNQEKWLKKSDFLLQRELNKQITTCGLHYEKSIGYHSQLLKNIILLSIYLNKRKENSHLLEKFAKQMYNGYLYITNNGTIYSHFNDSNEGMVLSVEIISSLAHNLKLDSYNQYEFDASSIGLGRLNHKFFNIVWNSGEIRAKNQPGHAHADSGNFCVSIDCIPFIVDRGISTYENNEMRYSQKIDAAHNCAVIGDEVTLDFWKSFRIGKRNKIEYNSQSVNSLNIKNYSNYINNVFKERKIIVFLNNMSIFDKICNDSDKEINIYFHFHPEIKIDIKAEDGEYYYILGTRQKFNKGIEIKVNKLNNCLIEDYYYCRDFNDVRIAKRLVISSLEKQVETIINYKII